jgi:hypothetical protein
MPYPKIAACVLSALLASGCSTTPLLTPPPPVTMPEALLRQCPDLQPLRGGSFPEVAGKLVELTGKYYECAAFHNALVLAVKRRLEK